MASGRTKNTRNQSEMKLQSTGATTGYEAQLWQMADALRGSMDAAAYRFLAILPTFSSQLKPFNLTYQLDRWGGAGQ